ncbi:MAG: acyl-ACP--UDP-N-acetylglucosamine O-acyltransferase [Thermoguttaceae bacterium]|jgi:UDP-N-acetylglucosamine acyltransferase
MSIHPSALIGPHVKLGANVRIGPFSVVEDGATLGDGCILEGCVAVKSGTTLGRDNHVFEGAVLGGPAQHVHPPEHPGRVVIGSGNTIREHVTIHRPLEADHQTTIGDHCLLMANAHVAHDCSVGDHVILTNNVMLGGHVSVGCRAFVSGGVAVHQFCRVGSLAMVGGQARIVKDVPPFVTIDGQSGYVVGLNQVGLKRAGHGQDVILRLKAAYRLIYRSGLMWEEMLRKLQEEFTEGLAAQFFPFLAATTRGIIPERRMPPGATIKLHGADEEEASVPQLRAKAG